MAETEDGFVGRWSRLKRRERRRGTIPAPDEAEAPPAPAPKETAEAAEPATNEIVEQLPDIETLDEESDFTVFLKEGVPEELRKRALRRLWRLNPVFANLDGLNDYDEDFAAEALLGGVKTLYQVGKGMVTPEEPAGDAAAEADPEAEGGEALATAQETAQGGDDEAAAGQVAGRIEPGTSAPEIDAAATAAPADESDAGGTPVAPVGTPAGRSAARRRWGRFES
jgi:hypothetical protein